MGLPRNSRCLLTGRSSVESELREQAIEKKNIDKNKRAISFTDELIAADSEEKRFESEEKLKKGFIKMAHELCLPFESFDILKQNVKVVELGEVLAFPKKGLKPGIKLGINGTVKCK